MEHFPTRIQSQSQCHFVLNVIEDFCIQEVSVNNGIMLTYSTIVANILSQIIYLIVNILQGVTVELTDE